MSEIAIAFIVLAPIGSAVFLIGTMSLYWAWLPAALLAAGALFNYLAGNWAWPRSSSRWLWPFAAFLVIATFSLITSPYRDEAMMKGAVQIAGITMMLLMVMGLVGMVRECQAFLVRILHLTSVVLGVVGVIAIIQFVVNNVFRAPVIGFEFLQVFGGRSGWRAPGMLGGMFRANSIEGEPAHMATFLCIGAGLAFMRLGGCGAQARNAPLVQKIVPQWAAIGIIAGLITSLSLIGYVGLAVVMATTALVWFTMRPRERKARRRISWSKISAVAGIVAVALVVPFVAGGDLVQKLSTITSIYDKPTSTDETDIASTVDFASQAGNRLSALALAANVTVMLENLRDRPLIGVGIGAHGTAYNVHRPDYVELFPALIGMNKDDAGALITRLLSEAGLIGTALFLIGGIWVFWTGMCATRLCAALQGGGGESVAPVVAALTGSWLAVFLLYLTRYGQYYSPPFWMSLALVVLAVDVAVCAVRSPARPPDRIWWRTLFPRQ